MPEPTDLVTDLPADFEVFGQAVDTDFQDLLGGTTGQVLSKTSGTDLDFTWINNDTGDITGVTAGTGISGGGTSGTVTVTNSMATAIDAKGDLIAGTGADAFSRLAVGTNAYVLTADSAEATGLKWATASSGALTKVSSGAGNFTSVSSVSLDGVFSATYDYYRVVLWYSSDNEVALTLRWRISAADNTGSNSYGVTRSTDLNSTNSYSPDTAASFNTLSARSNTDANAISMDIFNPFLSTRSTSFNGIGWSRGSNSGDSIATINFAGIKAVNTSFDGFSLIIASGTITGTLKVYGYQN